MFTMRPIEVNVKKQLNYWDLHALPTFTTNEWAGDCRRLAHSPLLVLRCKVEMKEEISSIGGKESVSESCNKLFLEDWGI